MKLKAVVSDNCPAILVEAFDKIRPIVMQRVVTLHLKRPNFGPAEFYVQKCDLADGETHEQFCEVRLTGVSLARDRSIQDFSNACEALKLIYEELIQEYLPLGQKMQLYVQVYLDEAIEGSTIVEKIPEWIQGLCQVEPLHG